MSDQLDVVSIRLITLVEAEPHIYSTKEKVLRKDRQDAYTRVGKYLKITGEECKKRWKKIRDKYVRIKRKGDCQKGPFVELLSFLDDHVKSRPTHTLISDKNSASTSIDNNAALNQLFSYNFFYESDTEDSDDFCDTYTAKDPRDCVEAQLEEMHYGRGAAAEEVKNSGNNSADVNIPRKSGAQVSTVESVKAAGDAPSDLTVIKKEDVNSTIIEENPANRKRNLNSAFGVYVVEKLHDLPESISRIKRKKMLQLLEESD